MISERAMVSRRFMPPDRSSTLRVALVGRAGRRRAARRRARRPRALRDAEVAAVDEEVLAHVELVVEGVLLRADAEPGPDRATRGSAGSMPEDRAARRRSAARRRRPSASSRTCRRRWGRGTRRPRRGRTSTSMPRDRLEVAEATCAARGRATIERSVGACASGPSSATIAAGSTRARADHKGSGHRPSHGRHHGGPCRDGRLSVAWGRMEGWPEAAAAAQALAAFSEPTRTWFEAAFAAPTPAQVGAWEAIAAGRNALVVAPTGSGKTLAAFLWSLDRLATTPPPADKRHALPGALRLAAQGARRRRRAQPARAADRHPAHRRPARRCRSPTSPSGVRSGDTPAADRRTARHDAARHPDHHARVAVPDAHLAGARGAARRRDGHRRRGARGRRHQARRPPRAVARAARRAARAARAQRIGLSATVRPIEEVARFLGGAAPVEVVAPPSTKEWDLEVVVPVEDMTELGAAERRRPRGSGRRQRRAARLDLAARRGAHRRPRRAAPLDHRLRQLPPARRAAHRPAQRDRRRARRRAVDAVADAPGEPARPQIMAQSGAVRRRGAGHRPRPPRLGLQGAAGAHRGRPQGGRLPCVVATSSLELGIDMGAVDLVVQVESPPSVASGLQRVGRAGHQVGEVSRGVLFPKHRGDLVHTAVAVERMRAGRDRVAARPGQPARRARPAGRRRDRRSTSGTSTSSSTVVRRAAPFASLPRSAFDADARPARRAATRATSSPSCGRGSCGTASPARSPAARARSGSR